MKLSERLLAASELQGIGELEWAHTTRLGLKLSIFGDQISFCNDGDFISLQEAQEAITYLADQLGMEVVVRGTTKKNKKASKG